MGDFDRHTFSKRDLSRRNILKYYNDKYVQIYHQL